MTKRDVPFRILTGTVDLERRKMASGREAEEQQVAEHPKVETEMRTRATQKASLRHIYEIAQYLDKRDMTFGKEDSTDKALSEIRSEILSGFVDSEPGMDLAIKGAGEFPIRHMMPWIKAEEWAHMTKLGAWEGNPYVYMTDGEEDDRELRDFGKRVSDVIQLGTAIRYSLKLAPKGRNFRQDLTLDGALKKMEEARFIELSEGTRNFIQRAMGELEALEETETGGKGIPA